MAIVCLYFLSCRWLDCSLFVMAENYNKISMKINKFVPEILTVTFFIDGNEGQNVLKIFLSLHYNTLVIEILI